MEFFKEDQLYQYFVEAIQRATSKEYSALEKELKTLRSGAFQQLSLGFEQRKNSAIATMEDVLSHEHLKQLSRLEHALNRSLAIYREELVEGLIQKLKLHYHQYQATKAYEVELLQGIKQLKAKEIDFVAVSSLDYAKMMNTTAFKIQKDESISAGFIAHFEGGKKKIDETLDAKLLLARNWFYEHVALVITQEENDEVKV